MDRDRDRDRDRERRFAAPFPLPSTLPSDSLPARDDLCPISYFPAANMEDRDDRFSNTYRPRSPGPRIDSYRANRSPPPRRGLSGADTYTPGGRASRPRSRSPSFRRRSRSPRRDDRRDDDRWRARPRSPPRRAYSPRREEFRNDRARSPPRREYDSYTRSPRRERSPPPRERERELSPARSRGARSPRRSSRYEEPRSRAQSPPRRYSPVPIRDNRDYRRRSPSPRRERVEPFVADTWRRRSPSPIRAPYASNEASGRDSAATSRRSSPPPIHPSRAALVSEDRPMRDVGSAPRSPYRERDHDREREYNRERERERERSPPRHRETPPTGPRSDRDREFAPPSGPSSSFRNGDMNYPRAPPTGPSNRGYPTPAMSPPIGPSNPAPQAQHPFPRVHNPVLAAPTRPRGGGRGGFGYDAPRDFSGPPRRGSAHWGPRGGSHLGGGPPSGPRGSVSSASGTGPTAFAPPFRGSSNSTSTTYPRTQRFQNHLADLPKEITGGQRAPEVYETSKITKLEEEARRLRQLIEEKESIRRPSIKDYDRAEMVSNNAALAADLAEQHLRSLNGDGEIGGAAF
ncbi:hypothetical protein P280DRAFT_451408 [Massarina eburnea CBS 473.64]|uniref:Uncharacterized protein n=1 Tax=Massarina eburnea CBS 473.64 TaxID=1395130 RepID=A0A6A6S2Y2_9PLEO|nr:hypothetical protein P280DRAFT_451408 [Massarina eburnea CBS 473.64]